MDYIGTKENTKNDIIEYAPLVIGVVTAIATGISLSNDGNKDVAGIVTLILVGTTFLGLTIGQLTKTGGMVSTVFYVLVGIYIVFLGVIYAAALIRAAGQGYVVHMKKQTIKVYKGDKPCNIKIESKFDNIKHNMTYLIRKLKEGCKIDGIYNNKFIKSDDIDQGLLYHFEELKKTDRLRLYSNEQFTIEFASEKLAKEHGFKTKSVTSKLKDVIIDKKKNKKPYHIIEQETELNMEVRGLFPQGNGWFLNPDEYWMKHK